MIEVESKFLFTDERTTEVLSRAGAKVTGERKFTDMYYDTKDFGLTLADHWLRRRDDCWQLKYPARDRNIPDCPTASFLISTLYREAETDSDILSSLFALCTNTQKAPSLNFKSCKLDELSIESFIEENQCFVFAEITTKRLSYDLDGVRIDLDVTNTGYRVGELEVMVRSTSDIDWARSKINDLAAKIGKYCWYHCWLLEINDFKFNRRRNCLQIQ